MSDVGKAEAKAPASEAVAENEPIVTSKVEGAVVDAEKPKETEEEGEITEAVEKTAEEIAAEALEAAETEAEDKKTPSARKREKIKARIDALEAENQRLTERVQAAERTKPALDQLGPKPDRAKYEDDTEYLADLSAWKTEERILARQAKTHETNTSTARADAAEAGMKLFRERALALVDTYPDIEAKVFNDQSLPMSAVMAETLMASEKGPEVAYYLSANREEAQRIKSMSPLAAAAALGRLEAKLSLPKPRTETKAPPPPATVSGTVRGPAKKLEDMSMAEYRKARGFDK